MIRFKHNEVNSGYRDRYASHQNCLKIVMLHFFTWTGYTLNLSKVHNNLSPWIKVISCFLRANKSITIDLKICTYIIDKIVCCLWRFHLPTGAFIAFMIINQWLTHYPLCYFFGDKSKCDLLFHNDKQLDYFDDWTLMWLIIKFYLE